MHPLAAQLQACDSPSAVIAVLQQQVQELDPSTGNDNKLTKWLDPTVNVLYALSATLGEGVGLVRLNPQYMILRSARPSYPFDRYYHRRKSSLLESVSSF